MLGRARQAGIERVDVHVVIVGDIAADHRALEEVHVVQILGQPGCVIQILRGGIAVFVAFQIHDMHRRTRRAEMHVGAGQMQVLPGVAGMERDVARGHGQHILDQGARKADAPVIAQDRPGPGQQLHPRRRGLRQADHLQRLQRRGMDLGHARLGQRAVLPARQSGPHGAQIFRQRG